MFVLLTIEPLLPDDSRPVLRAAQAQDRRLTGAENAIWYPAITRAPVLGIKLFDGNFTASVEPGSATFAVNLLALGLTGVDMTACVWAGAAVKIYAVPSTAEVFVTSGGVRVIDEFDNFVIDDLSVGEVFTGRIETFGIEGQTLNVTAQVDDAAFARNALTLTYAGTSGAEGEADLKDKLKPWVFGRALNVEPVLINTVDNVFQFSGYGPIEAVNAMYERGASFGASLGDHANYAALVAATIPEGHWATCLAQGMVRLGAPPYGVITGDVDGDSPADGDWIRLTGEILRRVALNAGVDESLLSASLEALDVAVPYPVNLVLTDQESVLALARRMVPACNAQAGISWLGQLFATRVEIGAPLLTLDAQGRQLPAVLKSAESDVSPPYKRIQMGAARCWRVHTLDEIAFNAPLLELGAWDVATTYREGNIVEALDKSRWLYTATTPSAGHDPLTSSGYWELLTQGSITLFNATSPPTANAVDDLWTDSSTGQIYRWDGADWVLISDITSTNQVKVEIVTALSVPADYLGVVDPALFSFFQTPTVQRGSTDIRQLDSSTYAIVTSGMTAAIDNTNGSATKGEVEITAISNNVSYFDLTVTVDGTVQPTIRVTYTKVLGSPPPVTGTGTKIASDTSFATLSTTSYVAMTDVMTVTLATGERLVATAPLDYTISGSGGVDRTLTAKWQYSPAGAGTWTDFASAIVGDPAYAPFRAAGEYEPGSPGHGDYNQIKTGLAAGDYDVRMVGLLDASGRNAFPDGTATIEAKV